MSVEKNEWPVEVYGWFDRGRFYTARYRPGQLTGVRTFVPDSAPNVLTRDEARHCAQDMAVRVSGLHRDVRPEVEALIDRLRRYSEAEDPR